MSLNDLLIITCLVAVAVVPLFGADFGVPEERQENFSLHVPILPVNEGEEGVPPPPPANSGEKLAGGGGGGDLC
jgi:hypothetical protein